MQTAIIFPPSLSFFDGLTFRMIVCRERNIVLSQVPQHFLLPFGNNLVFAHKRYLRRGKGSAFFAYMQIKSDIFRINATFLFRVAGSLLSELDL